MTERLLQHRRFVTAERGNHRFVRNVGNSPRVLKSRLNELAISTPGFPDGSLQHNYTYIPNSERGLDLEGNVFPEEGTFGGAESVIAPVVKKPITAVYHTGWGGGRTGGGGTSKESLRRAKQKGKKKWIKTLQALKKR